MSTLVRRRFSAQNPFSEHPVESSTCSESVAKTNSKPTCLPVDTLAQAAMPLLSAKRLPLRVPSTGTVMEVCPDSENVEPVNVPLSCPVIDAVAPAAVTVKPEGPLPSVTLTNVAPANERQTLHR
jgi:hypothetical protein